MCGVHTGIDHATFEIETVAVLSDTTAREHFSDAEGTQVIRYRARRAGVVANPDDLVGLETGLQ